MINTKPYLVNIKTKEHRICYYETIPRSGTTDWELVWGDSDGFILWPQTTSECPVPEGTPIEAIFAGAPNAPQLVTNPELMPWGLRDDSVSIIAYKPLLDFKNQEENSMTLTIGKEYYLSRVCKVEVLCYTNVGSPYDPVVVYKTLENSKAMPSNFVDWAVESAFEEIDKEKEDWVHDVSKFLYKNISLLPSSASTNTTRIAEELYKAFKSGELPNLSEEE